MNGTVARIVELLFQDVEMSDEVKAIYDEVMDNCQERFVDLLGRGLTEDEAIAAVVESLKGMEEVLASYPRKDGVSKAEPVRDTPVAEKTPEGSVAFSAANLRQIEVKLKHENVSIEPSDDDLIHVTTGSENDNIQVDMVSGELRVIRDESAREEADHRERKSSRDVHVDFFAKDFSFANLGEMLGKLMHSIQVNFDGDERVCIQVPRTARLDGVRVRTTSGNVGIDDLTMNTLNISTLSGDLRVEVSEHQPLTCAKMSTTSGDVEAWMHTERASMQSLSGDLRYVGAARELSASSTSGDVTIELEDRVICECCEVRSVSGDVECSGAIRQLKTSTTSGDMTLETASETVSFGSVSGDVEMRMRGDRLRAVEGHTTSGDVHIDVPSGTREAEIIVDRKSVV